MLPLVPVRIDTVPKVALFVLQNITCSHSLPPKAAICFCAKIHVLRARARARALSAAQRSCSWPAMRITAGAHVRNRLREIEGGDGGEDRRGDGRGHGIGHCTCCGRCRVVAGVSSCRRAEAGVAQPGERVRAEAVQLIDRRGDHEGWQLGDVCARVGGSRPATPRQAWCQPSTAPRPRTVAAPCP